MMKLSFMDPWFNDFYIPYRYKLVLCKKCNPLKDHCKLFIIFHTSFFNFSFIKVYLVMTYFVPFWYPEVECGKKNFIELLIHLRKAPSELFLGISCGKSSYQPAKITQGT